MDQTASERRASVVQAGTWQCDIHLTQVLSGHGCFRAFLNKIGREATLECHHCGAAVDDARYTLFACTSWAEERIEATRVLGTFDRLSIVEKMLTSKECWDTVCKFAFTVMLKKEYAERSRRGEGART